MSHMFRLDIMNQKKSVRIKSSVTLSMYQTFLISYCLLRKTIDWAG